MNLKKGFTLIELLTVVAIIGVLAAAILAALNNARDKGSDAAVKSNLVNAMKQAEIYYYTNTGAPNSYLETTGTPFVNGVCSNAVVSGIGGAGILVQAAAKAAGMVSVITAGTRVPPNVVTNNYYMHAGSGSQIPTSVVPPFAICNHGGQGWAAEVPMKGGGYWCVDSTGSSSQRATSTLTAENDRTCG